MGIHRNSLPDDTQQRLCATAPVDGLTGVNITMDINNPASGAPLPGSTQLGGVLGVLAAACFSSAPTPPRGSPTR